MGDDVAVRVLYMFIVHVEKTYLHEQGLSCKKKWAILENSLNIYVTSRDYREGRPLLTVETEVNGDSKRTNDKGSFLVGSLGLSCR